MIRLLLVALLLVSTNSYAAKVYGNLDPCIVYDGKKSCLASASAQEIAEGDKYWLEPSLDEDEVEALKKYKVGHGADLGTTAVGLLFCTAVVEANPVGILIPAAKWVHYKNLEHHAKKSPRVYSTATGINVNAAVGAGAAAWNLGILAKCL
jgi:hypothetical protein